MARKKVNKDEIKEEVVEKDIEEKVEEVKETETTSVEVLKKKINVWSELKSFFIILVIIGLFILGGWAWYSSIKDHDGDNKNEVDDNFKYAYRIVEDGTFEIDNVSYKINDNGYIENIVGKDGKTIDTGEDLYTDIFEGVDGNIYLVNYSDKDEGPIAVASIKDNKIDNKFTIEPREGYLTLRLLYSKSDDDYGDLAGFMQSEEGYDEDGDYTNKNYFITLDNKVIELDGYHLSSNYARVDVEDDYFTYNSRYVAFANSDETKYGLLDYKTGKIVVEAKYDLIFPTQNNTFIAEKNGKTGIIDAKEKVLVVFEYDFIDNNEGFYVIGKSDKLAIMNKSHEFVTGFEFKGGSNYSYKPCCGNNNDFGALKFGDKYLLMVENEVKTVNDEEYYFDNNYIIYANGKFETIEKSFIDYVDDGIVIFNEKSKTYSLYDSDLEERYTIDVSSFAFAKEPQYFYSLGNIIGICGKDVYFDKDTGKELELDKVVVEDKNFKFEYDKKYVRVFIDGKEVYKYESDLNEYYNALTIEKDGYTIADYNGDKKVVIYKK